MNCPNSSELLFQLIALLDKKFVRPVSLNMKPLLSPLQVHVLSILKEKNATMTELAAEIYISKQQLTPLVDKLVAEGLVQREYDKSDRRTINVTLTDSGSQLLESVSSIAMNVLKNKLDCLDQADMNCLTAALSDLHRIIKKLP